MFSSRFSELSAASNTEYWLVSRSMNPTSPALRSRSMSKGRLSWPRASAMLTLVAMVVAPDPILVGRNTYRGPRRSGACALSPRLASSRPSTSWMVPALNGGWRNSRMPARMVRSSTLGSQERCTATNWVSPACNRTRSLNWLTSRSDSTDKKITSGGLPRNRAPNAASLGYWSSLRRTMKRCEWLRACSSASPSSLSGQMMTPFSMLIARAARRPPEVDLPSLMNYEAPLAQG